MPSVDDSRIPNLDVLITGSYSARNKGDLAMQLVAAEAFKHAGRSVTVCVPFPDDDRAAYDVIGVDVVRSNRRNLLLAYLQIVGIGLWRLLGCRPRVLVSAESLRAFIEAGVVVDLSGDMLTDDYGPHVAMSHYVPLIKALGLGKPLVVLAQSIGPFRMTGWLARRILDRATLVTVRDSMSIGHLRTIGNEDAIHTADLAFLLANTQCQESRAAASLPGPLLGVSVSNLMASHHRKRSRSDRTFEEEMAEALDVLADKLGASILFVPHVFGPSALKDDRVIAQAIADLMRSDADVLASELPPGELKAVIANCSWFVGCRMHANIAAISSSVPTVCIAYSHKTWGIMRDLRLDDWVLDVSDLTSASVVTMVTKLIESEGAVRERSREVAPELVALSQRNIALALAVEPKREVSP